MPMKGPQIVHMLCRPDLTESSRIGVRGRLMAMFTRRIDHFFSKRAGAHVVESDAEAATKLRELGFSLDGLPAQLGGTLQPNQLLEWLQKNS